MNRLLLLLCLLAFQQTVFSQNIHTERIFLSPDKETCVPGDTLRVAGQLFSSDRFYPSSRYVYLECISQKDSVLLRQKIACDASGFFQTVLLTDVDWNPGVCYLRAYTRWMQNFSEESFSVTPFLLGIAHPDKEEYARELHARFFPEGGRLLEGFLQNVVFQLTDDDGFPVTDASSYLLDEKNDTVARAVGVPSSGLGRFSFHPEPGRQYRLLSVYHGAGHTFPLQTQAEGATLQAVVGRGRLVCRILSHESGDRFRLFLYHSEQGLQEIPFSPAEKMAVLDVSAYGQGILSLFLMDKSLNKLSERTVWIGKSADTLQSSPVTCSLPQTVMNPGQLLTYTLGVPDSSSVFVRVVRQDNLTSGQACTSLAWGGEVSSPVRFPLLDNPSPGDLEAVRNAWLMSASFSLFRPEVALKSGMSYPYLMEDCLLLRGTAWEKEDKPFGPGLIDVQNEQAGIFYTGKLEADGSFVVPVDNFPNHAPFLLTAKNLKGKVVDCEFTLQEDSFPKVVIPHPLTLHARVQSNVVLGDTTLRYSVDENERKVYHLSGVEVESRKPVDIRELSRMPFNYIGEDELQKWPGKSLRTLLNRFTAIKVEENGKGSGAGILRSRILDNRRRGNSMRIYKKDEELMSYGEPTIVWRNSMRYAFLKGQGMGAALNVVVNGELVFGNISDILNYSAGDIKSIELIRPSDPRATVYGTPNGAVVIETVREVHLHQDDQQGEVVHPFGLTMWREAEARPVVAPFLPGTYRLLIDVVTPEKQVVSFSKEFSVQ